MKTNHTKDSQEKVARKNILNQQCDNLARSIKPPYITKDEQSDVRGIVEELDNLANIYGWHKDQCAGHSHSPACL